VTLLTYKAVLARTAVLATIVRADEVVAMGPEGTPVG
jgi:hypothetical protein